jgi:hypothetical protein
MLQCATVWFHESVWKHRSIVRGGRFYDEFRTPPDG